MTFSTDRNNVKPILGRIALMMMVLLRRLGAIMTELSIGAGQFADFNSVIYGVMRFFIIWIASFEIFVATFASYFALFGLVIFLTSFALSNFAFFTLSIAFLSSLEFFTLLVVFYCSLTLFGFLIFALRGSFRYDLLRHSRFSLNSERLCLEPIAGYTPAVGSSYYRVY